MNLSERGIQQPGEGLTRREASSRIAGLAAAALVLAGGCANGDLLPQGVQPGTKPPAMVEPQVQKPPMQMSREDAENLAGAVGLTTIVSLLVFLAAGGRRVKRNP